jgi:hypothetical protein
MIRVLAGASQQAPLSLSSERLVPLIRVLAGRGKPAECAAIAVHCLRFGQGCWVSRALVVGSRPLYSCSFTS